MPCRSYLSWFCSGAGHPFLAGFSRKAVEKLQWVARRGLKEVQARKDDDRDAKASERNSDAV